MKQAEIDLLVIAAQQGSKAAFGAIYAHFQVPLQRFAYRLCGDRALAQDAVQDAWLRTAKHLRRLDDVRAFRSWLYRSVRWQCLDLLKQRKREVAIAAQDSPEAAGEDMAGAIEASAGIAAALAKLPEVERQIVQLFYMDELSVAEIGSVLSVPAGTVKSRLHRARAMLKQKFEQ